MSRRAITSGLTLLLVGASIACSSSNNFVIVNESTGELEVRYRIRRFGEGPLETLPVRPAIKVIGEVDQQIAWHDLSDSEFEIDSQAHFVTVKLMPGYALRVGQLNLRDNPDQELAIDELFLNGVSGQTHLQGREVQKSFTPGRTYLLRYE